MLVGDARPHQRQQGGEDDHDGNENQEDDCRVRHLVADFLDYVEKLLHAILRRDGRLAHRAVLSG